MDIREKVNYWAKVCFISTLTHHRDLSVANILILRCNIFEIRKSVPLAVKVYWNRRTHGDKAPEVGDAVLVQAYRQHSHGSMRFRPITLTSKQEDKPMAMSKDRVRFFIGERYFAMSGTKHKMAETMGKAFGLSTDAARLWLQGAGFWITCRPSQFARFLIYRNAAGITNGFMDLQAELILPTETDVYYLLANRAGVSREDAKRVALVLNYDKGDLDELFIPGWREVDVSKNPA